MWPLWKKMNKNRCSGMTIPKSSHSRDASTEGSKMEKNLRLALGQINVTVGDLKGNAQKIMKAIDQARAMGVDLVAFPELAIPGYPPEDLLLNPTFVQDNLEALNRVDPGHHEESRLIVGFADMIDDIYNAAAILHEAGRSWMCTTKFISPITGSSMRTAIFRAGRRLWFLT